MQDDVALELEGRREVLRGLSRVYRDYQVLTGVQQLEGHQSSRCVLWAGHPPEVQDFGQVVHGATPVDTSSARASMSWSRSSSRVS